jgi:hypothetical protein
VSVRIYVEGGFESITKSNCRKAFRTFFEKTIPSGSFKVIASGNRSRAFRDFCTALSQHSSDYVILLVDSEGAVIRSPWAHLATREGDSWRRPASAGDDQAHFMVQVMESWFIADPDALARYYGPKFNRRALPRRINIEEISKIDVFHALRNATKNTAKGEYHKTRDGFGLVEEIDPALIRGASTHAERLLAVLERQTLRN